jgi:hypothetical protein
MDQYVDETRNPYAQTVDTYLASDFTTEGALGRELMANAQWEATADEISLSDIAGSEPPNLTPAMLGWYQSHVAPARKEAISALSRYFADLSATDKAGGFAFALREGSLDEQLLRDKLKLYKDHSDRFHGEAAQIRQIQAQLEEERRRYESRKAELGRDARILNRPLYLSVLALVIFGSEAALNLESFEALPWATPAIAWGATIIIGMAIGLAAHYHGTVYRQWAYYFGPAEDDTKRGPAMRMFIGGATTLTLALAFVYYARSAYLLAYTSSVGTFGQGSPDGGLVWIVAGSLLGNMLVYLTGVLWAYLLHDSDPDFVESRICVAALEKTLAGLEKRMEDFRTRALDQLNAGHKRSLEAARRSYASVCTQPRFRQAQDLFARVQKKDDEVLALLLAYRIKLMQALGQARKMRFVAWNDGPHLRHEHITPAEYQRRPIKLKYLET